MNDLQMTREAKLNAFLAGKKAENAVVLPQAPRPSLITMNGNTGQFTLSMYDKVKRERIKTPLAGKIVGSILAIRWMCKSDYEEDATEWWETREFKSWTVPVTLLHSKKGEKMPEVLGTYPTYQDFKKAMTTVNPITKAETYTFSLIANVYFFNTDMQTVQCIQARMSGNAGLFDYFKTFQEGFEGIEDLSQAKTEVYSVAVTSDKVKDDKTGEWKVFYGIRFKTVGVNSIDEMMQIMDYDEPLQEWLASREGETLPTVQAIAAPVHEAPAVMPYLPEEAKRPPEGENQGIRVEDIPF